MTQQVTLSGPQTAAYIGVAESHLAVGIPQGMRRLAQAMEAAAAGQAFL